MDACNLMAGGSPDARHCAHQVELQVDDEDPIGRAKTLCRHMTAKIVQDSLRCTGERSSAHLFETVAHMMECFGPRGAALMAFFTDRQKQVSHLQI